MKNKIKEKIIASVLLSAFMVTNLVTATFAMEDYGYGVSRPAIRSGASSEVGISSDITIPNANSIVNLSLREADITQVLRMFADQAGMNIIFTDGIEGTVTMDLVNIPLKEALDLVVRTHKLYYDIKANTLVISTEESALNLADRSKTITIIPVKYVNALALSHFLNKSVFSPKGKGVARPGMSGGFIAATNPATNDLIITGTPQDVAIARSVVEQFDKKPTVTTFKVNHTTPAEMASSLCTSLFPSMSIISSDEDGASGGASGGAAGIVTGFASDEDSSDSSSSSSSGGSGASMGISIGGAKLACAMSSQQKTSESSEGEDSYTLESLPLMNLSVSYFPTQGTIQVVGGSETQIDMIREYIAMNDKKTPQAYLEVQLIELTESGSKTFDNTWTFLSKNFSFNAGGGQGFSTSKLYPVFFAGRGYALTDGEWDAEKGQYNITGQVAKYGWNPALGRYTSTTPQLMYAVKYIVENNKGRVLANPRVLLTSGQQSTIDLTSDYVSKVTTQYLDSGSASGSAQVQKDYEISDDNGIKVTITPFISPDGYVTLDIKPEYKTVATTITDSTTGDIAATLLQRRDLDLKGVRIKDGETLVIGGMINESETKGVSKIPFLGDIPVVGMFFRSTTTKKEKHEMVIMLTPQIVVDTEDAVADDNML